MVFLIAPSKKSVIFCSGCSFPSGKGVKARNTILTLISSKIGGVRHPPCLDFRKGGDYEPRSSTK
jgi:hypothetical protein